MLPIHRRWIWLVIASCWFYMAFIPAYILILLAVVIVDYVAGLLIEKAEGQRRTLILVGSLCTNIGFLAIFKYLDFALANVNEIFASLGMGGLAWAFPFVLPIGLSFHTFQSMAYTIEVYQGKQPAEKHLGIYSLYVLFYPQMVAGPIERPQNILPQLHQGISGGTKDDWIQGLQLMAWGFFKKVVIADRLAEYVDSAYNSTSQDSGVLLIAAYFFAFQIYCDFSGYTDIARGAARTMGIKFMVNFDYPYCSRSLGEFWRRWHISLSTWFRDYVFVPLGGSRLGQWKTCRNLMVVFLISGIWHGASWTFLIWGGIHGAFVVGQRLTACTQFGDRLLRSWGSSWLGRSSQVLLTFHVVVLTWIFFRAGSMHKISEIFSVLTDLTPYAMFAALSRADALYGVLLIVVLESLQWFHRKKNFKIRLASLPIVVQWSLWYLLGAIILIFGRFGHEQFLYFQF
jgi:alginate O-acetyltransferase complex protein AlgI